ncbi:MAG TPA: undecaprenyl-diphosphate phosphatase, partial [Acholeplasma sp.]|nr:undecaprenyl-diphosphate phosphatase [Acholeplasma sp.]
GLSLMLTGSLLFLIYKNRNDEAASDEISFVNALLIGTVQVAAIFPGISRSGSTIIGGLMQKISLTALLKFSFLAYIIISVPTALLGFYELSTTTLVINWTGYTLAFIATFIATYLAAFMVMKKIKTKHLIYFSIYCLVIGVTVATLSFFI